jgi:ferredoxin
MESSRLLVAVLAVTVFVGFGAFALTFLREGARRAAGIALAMGLVISLASLLTLLLPIWAQVALLAIVVMAAALGLVLFLSPVGRVEPRYDVPRARIDERDIMFARARLEPGGDHYESYYAMRPENKPGDDKTRSLPGLGSPKSSAYHPLVYASTDASFGLTEALRDAVDGPVAPEPPGHDYDSPTLTAFVKDLARYYGALTVGVAELQPYHVYSHVGRGPGQYGTPVEVEHRFAVAFTVEMDLKHVATAPYAPTFMESAKEYVEAARVAVQLANFIRLLGYPARAHIDGNYRVIAPLVARDAGLGEIGRMGLLMTPELGPRVRLGVVTTDLPLVPDGRGEDRSVLDFCSVCSKCADTCPPHAIPQGDRVEIDGAFRWRINDAICFRYWNAVGTDCARCMAVCPYSHPDSAMHNLVRWAVRRSGVARRAAVRLDDLFYGRLPPVKPRPAWIPPGPRDLPG